MSEVSLEYISKAKVEAIITGLMLTCEGPREAFGTLVCAIIELSKLNDTYDVETLITDFSATARSVSDVKETSIN